MRARHNVVAAGAAATIALTLVMSSAAPAAASAVGDHVRAEKRLGRQIRRVATHGELRAKVLRRSLVRAQRADDSRPGLATVSELTRARRQERRFLRRTERRLRTLRAERDAVRAWLWTWGVFRVCPVDAPRYIHNDYGEVVNVEGVDPHVHRGSDIEAPTWTPIRAPFDGYAWGSYSPLGGYQVRVRGDRGYVFNAHLISYGDLGWVHAGTVVGYVGATGDSTAPHDHFEWHPWDGGAVDPYYLLTLACD